MFLLIGVSFLVAFLFLVMFIWAVKSGQYDDTYTPSVRILFDDDLDSTDGNEDKPTIQTEDKPVAGEKK